MTPEQDDQGSVMMLSLVYTLIAGILVLVVIGASQVHLTRTRLQDLADAAALDAADGLNTEEALQSRIVSGSGQGRALPLQDKRVRELVAEYVVLADAERFDDFQVEPRTGTIDGGTAVVGLTATIDPPMASLISGKWRDGIPLRVTGRSRGGID